MRQWKVRVGDDQVALVELRGPEGTGSHFAAHRLQQVAVLQPSPEARLVEVTAEHRLAQRLQLAEGELVRQEAEWQVQALDLRARRRGGGANQLGVVERQALVRRRLVHRRPAQLLEPLARPGVQGIERNERAVDDREAPGRARVARLAPDRGQQAQEGHPHAQPFARDPLRRGREVGVEIDPEHAARQRPLPLVRRLHALAEQDGERAVDDRQDRELDARERHRVGAGRWQFLGCVGHDRTLVACCGEVKYS